jgi:hypothetical protein
VAAGCPPGGFAILDRRVTPAVAARRHLRETAGSAVIADIWRDGTHWRQWADWQHPAPPRQPIGHTERRGTRTRWHLDPAYFGPTAALPANIPALLADLLDESRDCAVLSVDDQRTAQPSR